jgi:hypothetical protein
MKPAKQKQQEWSVIAENSPLSLALVHVDSLLERIQVRRLKAFEPSLIEQLRKLSTQEIKRLNLHYEQTHNDLKAALGGDPFYLEAYNHYEKSQIKVALNLLKALRSLKHDAKATGKLRIRQSGTRKRKQKSPEEITKKVLFLEKDKETGVSSLKPPQLVGASEMWVYNTKTRKLGCYYATNDNGLSAKGTTILNYNEKRSTTKTIRKPKIQIHEFIARSPSDMHKYWDAIRAVPQEITPRLNRDTLILRVFPTI